MPHNRTAPFVNHPKGISALPNEALLYIFDVLALDDARVHDIYSARLGAVESYLRGLRAEFKTAKKQLDRHIRKSGTQVDFGDRSGSRRHELEGKLKSLKREIAEIKDECHRVRLSCSEALGAKTWHARRLVQVCKRWRTIIHSNTPQLNTNVVIFLDDGVGTPTVNKDEYQGNLGTSDGTSDSANSCQASDGLVGRWDGTKIGAVLARSTTFPINICLTYSKRLENIPPPTPGPSKPQVKRRPGKGPPPAALAPAINPEIESARLSQFLSILLPHMHRVKRLSIHTVYASSMPSVPELFDSEDGSDFPLLEKLEIRNPLWRVVWTPKTRKRLDEHGKEVHDEDWTGRDPEEHDEEDEEEEGEEVVPEETSQEGTSFRPSTQTTSTSSTPLVVNGRLTRTERPPRYGPFIRNPAEAEKYWNPPVLRGYNILEALRDQEWVDHFCGPFPVVDSRQPYYQAYEERKKQRENARGQGDGKAKAKEKAPWEPPPPPRCAREIVFKDFRIGEGDNLQVADFLALLDRKRLGYIKRLTFENVEVYSFGPSPASSSSTPASSQGGTRRAINTESPQLAVKYLVFSFKSQTEARETISQPETTTVSPPSPSRSSFMSSFFSLTENRTFLASLTLDSVPVRSLPFATSASSFQAWSLNLKSLPANSFPHILNIVRNWNGLELHIDRCGDVVDDRLLHILTMKRGSMSWAPFVCGAQLRILHLTGPPEVNEPAYVDDGDTDMSEFEEDLAGFAPPEGPPATISSSTTAADPMPTPTRSSRPPQPAAPSIPKLAVTPHAIKELVLAREKDCQRHDPTTEKDLSFTLPLYSIVVQGAEHPISADDKKWLLDHVDYFMWSSDRKAPEDLKTEADGNIGARGVMKEGGGNVKEQKGIIEIPDSPAIVPKRESETEALDRSLEVLELSGGTAPSRTTADAQDVIVISDSDSDESRAATPVPTSQTSSSQPSRLHQSSQNESVMISDSEDDFMPLRPSSLLFLPASSPPPERFSSPAPGFLRVEGDDDTDAPMGPPPLRANVQLEPAQAAIDVVTPEPSPAVDMMATEPTNVARSTSRFVATFDSPVLENDICNMSLEEIEALDLDSKSAVAQPQPSSSLSGPCTTRSLPRFESPPLEADFSDIFSAEDIPDF